MQTLPQLSCFLPLRHPADRDTPDATPKTPCRGGRHGLFLHIEGAIVRSLFFLSAGLSRFTRLSAPQKAPASAGMMRFRSE